MDGCNRFLYRREFIREKLEKESADILCFQEVLPSMSQWLKENLKDYVFAGCGREQDLSGEEVCIAFKRERFSLIFMETYWLSPTPYLPGSRYEAQSPFPRICTELILKMETGVFRLINTHLDHIGAQARVLAMQQIIEKVRTEKFLAKLPVILTGDFNAEPDSEEIRSLEADGWINLTKGLGITFHGFTENDTPQSIDYIYLLPQDAEKDFAVKNVEKWTDRKGELWLSDHYPVCVCLEE